MNPNLGQSPDQLSLQLDRTLADKLLTEARARYTACSASCPA